MRNPRGKASLVRKGAAVRLMLAALVALPASLILPFLFPSPYAASPAYALSQIREIPGEADKPDDNTSPLRQPYPGSVMPLPEPAIAPANPDAGAGDGVSAPEDMTTPDGDQAPADDEPADDSPDGSPDNPQGTPPDTVGPSADPDPVDKAEPVKALPPIYDMTKLPEPVQRMRELILEAAKTGDVEKLRPLLGTGPGRTQLTVAASEGDPIDTLREISGDDEGQEILAILMDVLSTGAVQMDAGTDNAVYVWPYFVAAPIDKLTPAQRVELFRIVTAGDYSDMRAFGGYNFYRVGITPDGEWKFFVAGD